MNLDEKMRTVKTLVRLQRGTPATFLLFLRMQTTVAMLLLGASAKSNIRNVCICGDEI